MDYYNNNESDFFRKGGNSSNASSTTKQTPHLSSPERYLTSIEIFSKELSRLQERQILYTKKLEKEKRRKEDIEANIQIAKSNLSTIRDKTKNGNITKDFDIINQKKIGKVEHSLQSGKIKLSLAKTENIEFKRKIDNLRKDKLLYLQILHDLLVNVESGKETIKFHQKELLMINEKKHKVKLNISNAKSKMLKDMEEFSKEMQQTKLNISNTQNQILGTIREKLQTAFNTLEENDAKRELMSRQAPNGNQNKPLLNIQNRQEEIENLISNTNFTSVEQFLTELYKSEDKIFFLYNETQAKHEERDKLDQENKHLENEIEIQLEKLEDLEGNLEKVKQELENRITNLKESMAKYETDYSKNIEFLSSLSDTLMSLLRNLAKDEEQLDQQLLSTGINERNIENFLGLVEQRIDDLIQISKAAQHLTITKEDFVKLSSSHEKNGVFSLTHLPSLADNIDDDDDVDDGNKIQPVQINVLKDLMSKKINKSTFSPENNNNNNNNNQSKSHKTVNGRSNSKMVTSRGVSRSTFSFND